MSPSLREELFQEILMARRRVYNLAPPTPLEEIDLPLAANVFLKREDLSPIHAYKWRGAYNRMAKLSAGEIARGVICASAGNHAQGVALAAQRLGTRAKIFMPLATPRMKQTAVRHHGGDAIEIILFGDTYSDAAEEALRVQREEGQTFIHPYDDLAVMGGQGTLADECLMAGKGHFDVAYLQIGGGGMAAATACWLKHYDPSIRIVGVEGNRQASMKAAFDAGRPVRLEYLDVFCDGTAVRQAGELTYPLCHDLLDEIITVSNEEVCAAIQLLWESRRVIPEPSGAMGLAGLIADGARSKDQNALAILCGANMDFNQLAWIVRHAGIGSRSRRYYRFEINEKSGAMLDLLETILDGVNIAEFQYGKMQHDRAWPVIGFEASPPEMDLLARRLVELGVPHEEVTSQEDVEFRIIHYEPELFQHPWFIKYEFPERAGALRDLLKDTRGMANLVYFNYINTGERVGRAMMGFEFDDQDTRDQFLKMMRESGRVYQEISDEVMGRVL